MNLLDAEALTYDLMREHGLVPEWSIFFDRSKSRMGCCWYDRKAISLSAYIIPNATESEVRNTALHEIAHALAGYGAGHGWEWKAIAIRIGCSGDRCHSVATTADYKWKIVCSGCQHVWKYFRKPKERFAGCPHCGTWEIIKGERI